MAKVISCIIAVLIWQGNYKTGKAPTKFDLHRKMSSNRHFQAMHSQVAQQCLTTVAESFKSFFGLLKGIKKGTVTQRPRLPNYRKHGLNLVTYPKQAVKLKEQGLRFPLGKQVKAWFGIDSFYMPMPSNLDYKDIREYRILPRNGEFYLLSVKNPKGGQLLVNESSEVCIGLKMVSKLMQMPMVRRIF